MSQNGCEEISVQRVFDEISKYLKNEQLFERLLNILHEEVCINVSYINIIIKTINSQFYHLELNDIFYS